MKKVLLFLIVCLIVGNPVFAAVGPSSMGDTNSTMETNMNDNEHDCCDEQQASQSEPQDRCCDGSCDSCEHNCHSSSGLIAVNLDAPISSGEFSPSPPVQQPVVNINQLDYPPIS